MRYLAAVLIFALAPCAMPQARTPEEKLRLFNGRNLDGFSVYLRDSGASDPRRVFTVRDGRIVISGEQWGALTSVDEWRDYRLIVEWRWGGKTWPPREKLARDSGILLHGTGELNPQRNGRLEGYEHQIIEGGAGDMIPSAGERRPRASVEVRIGPDREAYFEAGSPAREFDRQRVNWYGRDVNWQDELGFRGLKDVERKMGEWNRSEIIAAGDALTFYLNGRLVNRFSKLSHTAGRIQLLSEGAEIWIRRLELEPVR